MPSAATSQTLKELKPPSSRRLPDSVITGMTLSLTQARYQLIRGERSPSGPGIRLVRTKGVTDVHASRKLMTINGTDGYTARLNQELAGGTTYPVLNAVLGTVAGAASAGAGLLFTIGTTAIDASRVHQGVQARDGDELWQVEEIGKVRNGGSWATVHVGSYFLVDPFRRQTLTKGWLIHEERNALTG